MLSIPNFDQLKPEVCDKFSFSGGMGGLSGPNFGQLKSEVSDNNSFLFGGGGTLWFDIPLTREGLSVKIGYKFCAQILHMWRLII